MKSKFFNVDSLISAFSFVLGCLIGNLIYVKVGVPVKKIIFVLICGVLLSGIVRIFFPYSRISLKKQRQIDNMARDINLNAFDGRRICRLKMKKIVRLYHNNQFQRALKRADALYADIKTDDDKFAVCYWTGMCCFKLGFFRDSCDEFSNCLSIRYNESVMANLADCYMHLEEYQNALECFSTLLAVEKKNYSYLCGSSICDFMLGNFSSAYDCASFAIDVCGDKPSAYILCLMSLRRSENYDKKRYIELLDTFKSKCPDFASKHPELEIFE